MDTIPAVDSSIDPTIPPTASPNPAVPNDLESRIRRGQLLVDQGIEERSQYTDPLLIDVGRGLGNAVPHLVSNFVDLANDVTGHPLGSSVPEWNYFGKTTTATGGLAQGITEFATDMFLTAGALKAVGVADKIKAVRFGAQLLPLAEGAATDFTAFRAHDSRLSDIAYDIGENNPFLRNFITEYLHSNKDDSWFEGRMKNVLEGAGLGALTGMAVKAFKAFKGVKAAQAAGGDQAAIEALIKHSKELEPDIESFLRGEKDFSGGVSDNTAKAVLMRVGNMGADDATSVLTSMQSMSNQLGMDFASLLRDRIQSIRVRGFEDFKGLDTQVANLSKSTPALLDRAVKIFTDNPKAASVIRPDGTLNDSLLDLSQFKDQLRNWFSPVANSTVPIHSVDDLKDVMRLAGLDDKAITDNIAAASEKAGLNGPDHLAHIIKNGDLQVSRYDLKYPTGNESFGLWKRLQDARDSIGVKNASQLTEANKQTAERVAANQAALNEFQANPPKSNVVKIGGLASQNLPEEVQAIKSMVSPEALENARANKLGAELKVLSDWSSEAIQNRSVEDFTKAYQQATDLAIKGQYSDSVLSDIKSAGDAQKKQDFNALQEFVKNAQAKVEEENSRILRQQIDEINASKTQGASQAQVDEPYGPLTQNRLWQSMSESPPVAQGVTDFVDQGKAIVTLFEKADATTFVHELGHIIRRNMPEAEIEKAAEALKVKDWRNWTREEEEKFADALQDKVFRGASKTPELDAILGRTEKIAAGIYRDMRSSPFGDRVSQSVKDFYEGDSNGVASADAPVMVTTDPEELSKAGQVIADALTKGDDFSQSLSDYGVNLFHTDSSTSLLKLTGTISKYVEEHVAPLLTKTESRAKVIQQSTKVAQDLGISTEAYVARLGELAGSTRNLSSAVVESKMLLYTVVSDFDQAAKNAAENRSLFNASKFLQSWDQVQRAMTYYRETQASVGRGLGIFNSQVAPINRVDRLKELIQKRGGADKVWELVEEVNRINTMTPAADQLRAKRTLLEQSKNWNLINGLRINAMLGSGQGFTQDAVSNAFKTLTLPLERALAAGFSSDMAGVREALSTYKAMGNQLFDSWRATSAAFKLGDTILDNTLENSHSRFLSGNTFGLAGTDLGRAIDFLGTVASFPSRLRMTGDELFKQLNYRSFMEARFTREAMEHGISDIGSINSYVQDSLRKVFDDLGRGVDNEALAYARQATFSTPLVEGFAGKLLAGAAAHPWTRLFVPFLKTNLNIFFDTVGHTPLVGALLKEQKAALRDLSSPEAKQVLAKWAVGGSVIATGLYLHQAGIITGIGSNDPKVRDQMKLDGWQPYSVVYTGLDGKKNYVAFNKIEPWGSILGLVSDFADTGLDMKAPDLESASTAMVASLWRNLGNKTYLKGIADVLGALQQPDHKLQNYLASFASSFVPRTFQMFSNDPYVREAQGVLDSIKTRLPGYSETLPPKRNLLGEPVHRTQGFLLPDEISPFAFSQSVKDPVKVELASLGNGFKNPDPVQYGVDYRQFKNSAGQTAYDRMLELVGKTTLKGQSLSQSLNGLIATRDYRKVVQTGDAGLPYRIGQVGQMFSKYHTAAEEQMLREFPQLRQQVYQGRTKQAAELVDALQKLQTGQK